jgi:hypothetical protein
MRLEVWATVLGAEGSCGPAPLAMSAGALLYVPAYLRTSVVLVARCLFRADMTRGCLFGNSSRPGKRFING